VDASASAGRISHWWRCILVPCSPQQGASRDCLVGWWIRLPQRRRNSTGCVFNRRKAQRFGRSSEASLAQTAVRCRRSGSGSAQSLACRPTYNSSTRLSTRCVSAADHRRGFA
jgi:hypothetical protein